MMILQNEVVTLNGWGLLRHNKTNKKASNFCARFPDEAILQFTKNKMENERTSDQSVRWNIEDD